MNELSNSTVSVVELTEESINETLAKLRELCDGKPTLKPDRIVVTKEGLELQRQRGEAMGIPGARLQDRIDRELVRAMSGGYDVEINSAGPKGITIEHVRWPRAFLPDSRQESREGGIGPHQPCAGVGATEDQSEG